MANHLRLQATFTILCVHSPSCAAVRLTCSTWNHSRPVTSLSYGPSGQPHAERASSSMQEQASRTTATATAADLARAFMPNPWPAGGPRQQRLGSARLAAAVPDACNACRGAAGVSTAAAQSAKRAQQQRMRPAGKPELDEWKADGSWSPSSSSAQECPGPACRLLFVAESQADCGGGRLSAGRATEPWVASWWPQQARAYHKSNAHQAAPFSM